VSHSEVSGFEFYLVLGALHLFYSLAYEEYEASAMICYLHEIVTEDKQNGNTVERF
jgi:hypothetical protein